MKLPYDTLAEIRCRLEEVSPNLTRYGDAQDANYFAQAVELAGVRIALLCWILIKLNFISLHYKLIILFSLQTCNSVISSASFDVKLRQLEDYYMTDSISRASSTMAKCVQAAKKHRQSKYFGQQNN